ncbi:MAG TPA: flagellar basal body rod modification protein [Candidatus Jeotgalibaca merdavium]|uniref:Flagellar basal body rod modification protein n=1 Tax=Candidatus Jeotgalibaca merdavium TaxID=2838627 RepID=A0A9D2HZM0_9LACT|nr:flagellar basal body rod modification protein [Candidatus Jeotgalibaca merdavium]
MEISQNFTIGSTAQVQAAAKTSNSDMNMEDFLKILAASLSMPSMGGSEGGSDQSMDYMSQMIQFSTIEQLQDLSTSLTTTMLMTQQQQALTMIGKEVTVVQDGERITGTVEKAKFLNGYATLHINGKDYYMNSVMEVGAGS